MKMLYEPTLRDSKNPAGFREELVHQRIMAARKRTVEPKEARHFRRAATDALSIAYEVS
jgi:hypothetical protein